MYWSGTITEAEYINAIKQQEDKPVTKEAMVKSFKENGKTNEDIFEELNQLYLSNAITKEQFDKALETLL